MNLGQTIPTVLRLNSQTFPMLDQERELLASIDARIVEIEGAGDEEIGTHAPEADAVMIVSAYLRTPVVEKLARCKVISRVGTGVDKIDIKQATSQGILVTNVPDFSTDEVADHTMALLLSVARQIRFYDATMRSGRQRHTGAEVHRLAVQTLGLVGFGRIGKAVAKRAKGFGMQVLVHDPYLSDETACEEGVTRSDLDTVIRLADYLSLFCPLSDETRGMISGRELARMKPSAVLVNTGRGELVVEADLVEALGNRTIRAAALDVFAGINVFAPDGFSTDHPFFGLDNVILTPHIAAYSEESLPDCHIRATQAVVDVLSGKWPTHVVNPEVRPWFE